MYFIAYIMKIMLLITILYIYGIMQKEEGKEVAKEESWSNQEIIVLLKKSDL